MRAPAGRQRPDRAAGPEPRIPHGLAWQWMESNIESGWATCPITQNGCVRIMSQSSLPQPAQRVTEVAARLRQAIDQEFHRFWPDGVSVLSTATINWDLLIGPKQLTDIYLLALAVRNNGRFVTFDSRISTEMALGAGSQHLTII